MAGRAGFETAVQLAFGALNQASFTTTGFVLTRDSRGLTIISTLDKDMWISIDGTNNHIFVPLAESQAVMLWLLYLDLPAGTTFYFKHNGAAPAAGTLTFQSIYRK